MPCKVFRSIVFWFRMTADRYLLPLDMCLSVVAVGLHGLAVYVLRTIKDTDTIQRCFLIHISISEIVLTLLNIVSAGELSYPPRIKTS